MASIGRDPNGRRRILFVAPDGKRKTIRLGKATQRTAEAFKTKIEALVIAALTGNPVEDEVARWLTDRDDMMLDKLAAVGLIPKRQSATLGNFTEDYINGRADAKPATKEVWGQGKRGLIEHFGASKPVREVTAGDADDYKMHLIASGLASMTVRKRLQFAKMVFRAMVRRKLISANPFDDVSVRATMTPGRQRFITREETDQLMEACPNGDWRVIVTLCRFGGLRCPSEVLSLRWQDVDWERQRVRVQSPKTEHHPGKASREIPLFPELATVLSEAFDAAPEGSVYVVDHRMRKSAQGKAGWRNCNLRTTFEKIVKRARLEPWPRLFHNLRASRETELCEQFPLHVVASWLGNTPTIAQRHYLQTTDQHFQQAVEATEGAAHNPAQRVPELCRMEPQEKTDNLVFAGKCDVLRPSANGEADGEGFEPPVD